MNGLRTRNSRPNLSNTRSQQATLGHSADRQIALRARQRLSQSSYRFLRTVDCCADNGVLTLRGQVPTFYLKQVAQSVLADLDGVQRIDNHVDVVSVRGLSSVRQTAS